MFLPKIAFNNLATNRSLTLPYFGIMAIFSGFSYVLINFLTNSSFYKIPAARILIGILIFGFIMISLLMLLYGRYANRFMSDERNNNMGIFLMLGMGKKQLLKIIYLEKFYLFAGTFLGGFVFGIAYSKIFFLFIRKLIVVGSIREQYSLAAFSWLLILNFFIYVIIYLSEYRSLKRRSIMDIFNSKAKRDNPRKISVFMGLIGTFALLAGYGLALTSPNATTSFSRFIYAACLVALGIFGTFSSGVIMLLTAIKMREAIYYDRRRFVVIASLLHRIRSSALSLATICIFSTATLVSLSVLTSLYLAKDNMVRLSSPRDVTVLSTADIEPNLVSIATRNHVALTNRQKLKISQSVYGDIKGNHLSINLNGGLTNDYQITVISLNSFNYSNGTHYHLKDNEILTYVPNGIAKSSDYIINGVEVINVKQIKKINFIFSPLHSFQPNFFIITDNPEILQTILKEKPTWGIMAGYHVKGRKIDQKHFYDKLETTDFNQLGANVVSRRQTESMFNTLFGGLLFIGIIFGTIFAILTAVTIYYRQLAEGIRDQDDYKVMIKLGMATKNIQDNIKAQINFTFTLPMLFALLNLILALPILYKIMTTFGFNDVGLFLKAIVICLLIYHFFYWLICRYTSKLYYRLVSKK
ncbi:FtsX-like permease family protein [Streptococcus sobrinus]|uniref:FtsX-like permease family protein n=1 Tax=Streptococcus sobrinus TaxID=1310 RepID=UPI0002FBA086|nr:FtsX-like permease family protein [Streptococcus sobrinus]OZV23311.1 peptide ABC transporter permease [Streptococcus sobrinus]